jgi:hypothetical protein
MWNFCKPALALRQISLLFCIKQLTVVYWATVDFISKVNGIWESICNVFAHTLILFHADSVNGQSNALRKIYLRSNFSFHYQAGMFYNLLSSWFWILSYRLSWNQTVPTEEVLTGSILATLQLLFQRNWYVIINNCSFPWAPPREPGTSAV